MHPLLNIAIGAARRAGDVIVRSLDRVGTLTVSEKNRNDFVSEVDRAAEQVVIAAIRKAYPSHGFLAEESGATEGDDYTWVIDPLDGTTNFLHGFPQFAVSIACRHRGRAEVGVVFDPQRSELFTAERGAGTLLDGRRLRVSQRLGLDGALVGTGFPFRENRRWLKPYLGMLETRHADDRGRAQAWRGFARSRLRRGRPARRVLGSRPRRRGTPPRATSSSRKRAAGSATSPAASTATAATCWPVRRAFTPRSSNCSRRSSTTSFANEPAGPARNHGRAGLESLSVFAPGDRA